MPTTNTISDAGVYQFTTNVQISLQQHDSMLRNTVDNVHCTGEQAQAAIIIDGPVMQDTIDGTDPGEWYGETVSTNIVYNQRWIKPLHKVVSIRTSPHTLEEVLIRPEGTYVKAVRESYNNAIDETIISALSGSALSGKVDSQVSVPFPTSNVIGDGTTILDSTMLRKALTILKQNNIDMNAPKFLVCSAAQESQLLGDEKVTSIDFINDKGLVIGKINTFLGFNIITTEKLNLSGSGDTAIRECFAFSKPCIQFGSWSDLKIRIDLLPTINYVSQIYATATMGCVRVQDKGIVAINVLDTIA